MALADSYGLFWNSENGDRKYNAESFEIWLKKFFTSGVFNGDLFVSAVSGMQVSVGTGYANVDGKVRFFDATTNLTLAVAGSTNPRIDTIVVERNDGDREITLKVVQGAYAETPVATAPVREGGIYQLVLAEIYVDAAVATITQENITDKRTDTTVCGYVTGTVEEMDFSQFAAQFKSYYQNFVDGNEAAFDEWFDHMKDQLSEDAAGHLQLEIDDINDSIGGIVNPLTVPIPSLVVSSYSYDGTAKNPEFAHLDTTKVIQKMQSNSFTDAGVYTITSSLKNSKTTIWSDNSTADREHYFRINKSVDVPVSLPNAYSGSALSITKLNVHSITGIKSVISSNPAIASILNYTDSVIELLIFSTGNTTIQITTNGNNNYESGSVSVPIEITEILKIVSWSEGTDDEVKKLIELASSGAIDLYKDCGWRIGDTREISISASNASGTFDGVTWSVGNGQPSQTIKMVLMDIGDFQTYNIVNPLENARIKPSFIVGTKEPLDTSCSNTAGNPNKWVNRALRNFCNGGFRESIPISIRPIFKKCYVKTDVEDTEDYFCFPSEYEYFGQTTFGFDEEGNKTKQIEWFKTTSNRTGSAIHSGSGSYPQNTLIITRSTVSGYQGYGDTVVVNGTTGNVDRLYTYPGAFRIIGFI